MVAVEAIVRTLLRARLLTVPNLPSRILWENHAEDDAGTPGVGTERPDPVQGEWWLRETLTTADEELRSIPANGATMFTMGLYIIEVAAPLGVGTIDAETLNAAIRQTINPGWSAAQGGVTLTIQHSRKRPRNPDPTAYILPCEIAWRAQWVNTVT